jgi:hypothetical protein
MTNDTKNLRKTNKYGNLTRNKNSLWKVSLLWNNMFIQIHFWGLNWRLQIKPTSISYVIFSELTYEIDVWFQEKFLTNNALCLILSPAYRA